MTVIQGSSNDTMTPVHSKGRYFFKGDQRVSTTHFDLSILHC